MESQIINHIGNMELLEEQKTAFLCSSKTTSRNIIESFDWVTHMSTDACVISGFQTKLEKDVLQLLLKRHIPIIIVLARKMYKNLPPEIMDAIERNEALVLSISNLSRNTKESAWKRNKFVMEQAADIIFGALDTNSSLYSLAQLYQNKIAKSPVTLPSTIQ